MGKSPRLFRMPTTCQDEDHTPANRAGVEVGRPGTGVASAGTESEVAEIVSGALARLPDISLYDVEVKGKGRGRVLQVTLEKPGGLTIDDCAAASEIISAALDENDPLDGPYRLDVASPGLERPLRTPGHFAAALGEIVSVKTVGSASVRGRLVDSDAEGIVVRESRDDGGPGGEADVRIAFGDISRARTVLDWEAETRSGSKVRRDRKPVRQGNAT